MGNVAQKIASAGNSKILLTERGASFGYNNLVVDMRSFPVMRKLGYPVVYDVTHSLQLPGAQGDSSGGQPEFIETLACAGVAAGWMGFSSRPMTIPRRRFLMAPTLCHYSASQLCWRS